MQHDPLLRAMARAIFDACYPGEEWSPVGFDEAERLGTPHYRQSADAARQVRTLMAVKGNS